MDIDARASDRNNAMLSQLIASKEMGAKDQENKRVLEGT